MASNIKGITVEISGNTTKLDQALKGVNKTSRDLQSELRQVNKALKFDPGNTTLLKQKQKLLAEAISNTKSKLDTLREAEKQAQQQFESGKLGEEKYRALQREVVKTEQELKGLETQASSTEMKLNKISATAEKVGNVSGKVAEKTKGISTAVTGVGAACTTMSIQAEDSMAKLWSLADHNVMSFDQMKQSAMDFSNETGIGFNDVCEQAYQLISAGTDTADVFTVMKGNASLSKTGFAELGDTVNLTTTILNAYKMGAEDLTKVSDILNVTQDRGKLTVAELSSTMGDVIPIAYANNLSFEQLSASYAALTKNGISCDKATTAIKGTISELGKSGSKSAAILKNETGKSFQELMASGKTLDEILTIVQSGADKAGVSLSDCFANEEARLGAQSLAQNSNDFKDSLEAINDSAGTTDKKLEDLQTSGKDFKKSLNEMKNSAILLGDTLAPVFDVIASIVKNVASILSGMSPQMRTFVVSIGLIIAAISPVASVISNVSKAVRTVTNGIKAFSLAMNVAKGVATTTSTGIKLLASVIGFITSPIGIAVLAITALVGGFIYLWNTSEGFRNFWIELWNNIKNIVSECVNAIGNFITVTIPNIINSIINWFAQLPGNIWNCLVQVINNIINWGSNMYNSAVNAVSNCINAVINWFSQLPGAIWNWLSNALNNVWNWASGLASAGYNAGSNLLNSIVSIVSSIPGHMLSIGRNIVQGIWEGISGAGGWLASKVSGFVDGVVDGFKAGLGIHSPSRVMKDMVGKFIPMGIGVGIEEEMPSLQDQINSNLNGLYSQLRKTVGEETAKTTASIVSSTELSSKGLNNKVEMTPAMAGINTSSMQAGASGIDNINNIEVVVYNTMDKFFERNMTTRIEKRISNNRNNYDKSKGRR